MLVPLIVIGAIGAAALLWAHVATHDPGATIAASSNASVATQEIAPPEAEAVPIPLAATNPEPATAPPAAKLAQAPASETSTPEMQVPVLTPAAPAATTLANTAPHPPIDGHNSQQPIRAETPEVTRAIDTPPDWPPIPAVKPPHPVSEVVQASHEARARQPQREPLRAELRSSSRRAERASAAQRHALTPVGNGPPIDATDLPPPEP
jgi:hypothetical protein